MVVVVTTMLQVGDVVVRGLSCDVVQERFGQEVWCGG